MSSSCSCPEVFCRFFAGAFACWERTAEGREVTGVNTVVLLHICRKVAEDGAVCFLKGEGRHGRQCQR